MTWSFFFSYTATDSFFSDSIEMDIQLLETWKNVSLTKKLGNKFWLNVNWDGLTLSSLSLVDSHSALNWMETHDCPEGR